MSCFLSTSEVLVAWYDGKAGGDFSDVWFMKYPFTGSTLKFGGNIDWDAADGYIFLFLCNTLRRRRYGHLRQLLLYSHWNMGDLHITLPTATRTMMSHFVEDLGLNKKKKIKESTKECGLVKEWFIMEVGWQLLHFAVLWNDLIHSH